MNKTVIIMDELGTFNNKNPTAAVITALAGQHIFILCNQNKSEHLTDRLEPHFETCAGAGRAFHTHYTAMRFYDPIHNREAQSRATLLLCLTPRAGLINPVRTIKQMG